MTLSWKSIGRTLVHASLGFNVGILGSELLHGDVRRAAVSVLIVTLLIVWLYLSARLDAWIDAKVAHAEAERAIAEIIVQDLRRMKGAGFELHLDSGDTRERGTRH